MQLLWRWGALVSHWRKCHGRLVLVFLLGMIGSVAAQESLRPPKGAATDASSVAEFRVRAGRKQLALVASMMDGKLWFNACSDLCTPQEGVFVTLPQNVSGQSPAWSAVEVIKGRQLLHVSLREHQGPRQFEVLAVAGLNWGGPKILFADFTVDSNSVLVAAEGLPVHSKSLEIRPSKEGHRVLVGDRRSDVELCGRPALLAPRLLVGEDLAFHSAKLQRLSRRERQLAQRITVNPVPAKQNEEPLPAVGLLRAMASSSALGSPVALTDGDEASRWSEARGGTGRGEFVNFRLTSGVELTALDFLVRSSTTQDEQGEAPSVLWLASKESLYRLDWPQDAWEKPGQWYRARLPKPIVSDCVSLVLERGQQEGVTAHLGFSEIRGVSALSSLSPVQLVERLGEAGAKGDAAAAQLEYSGQVGERAVVSAFGSLQGMARQRAWGVLRSYRCEVSAPVYARVLTGGNSDETRKAARALGRCKMDIEPIVEREYLSLVGSEQLSLLQALPNLTPALAVRLGLGALSAAVGRKKIEVREVLARASRREPAVEPLRRGLADTGLELGPKLHLLRSLGQPISRFEPQASQAIAKAVSEVRTFEQRYQLLQVAGEFVDLAKGRESQKISGFLMDNLRENNPYLRALAAAVVPDTERFRSVLLRLLSDSNVRVRQAAILRVASLGSDSYLPELLKRLNVDKWPFVRVAAVQALVGQGKAILVNDSLAAAVSEDDSEAVRRAAINGLARRGATGHVEPLLDRLRDTAEQPRVRAAAARALARLCQNSVMSELTRAVRRLTTLPVPEAAQILGKAALRALGVLNPPDLEARLAPLLTDHAPSELRFAAKAALAEAETCSALAAPPR